MSADLAIAIAAVVIPAILVYAIIAAGLTIREYTYDDAPPPPDETDDERTARHVETALRAVTDYRHDQDTP